MNILDGLGKRLIISAHLNLIQDPRSRLTNNVLHYPRLTTLLWESSDLVCLMILTVWLSSSYTRSVDPAPPARNSPVSWDLLLSVSKWTWVFHTTFLYGACNFHVPFVYGSCDLLNFLRLYYFILYISNSSHKQLPKVFSCPVKCRSNLILIKEFKIFLVQ